MYRTNDLSRQLNQQHGGLCCNECDTVFVTEFEFELHKYEIHVCMPIECNYSQKRMDSWWDALKGTNTRFPILVAIDRMMVQCVYLFAIFRILDIFWMQDNI